MQLAAERLGLSKYGQGITRPSKATRWLKVMSSICRNTSCRMRPGLNLARRRTDGFRTSARWQGMRTKLLQSLGRNPSAVVDLCGLAPAQA